MGKRLHLSASASFKKKKIKKKYWGKQHTGPTRLCKYSGENLIYLAKLSPKLPGASSLVSVGVFVLNFKVLQKDQSRRRKLQYSMCEYL